MILSPTSTYRKNHRERIKTTIAIKITIAATPQVSKEGGNKTLPLLGQAGKQQRRRGRRSCQSSLCEGKKAAFLFEKQMKVKPLGNSD